MGRNKKAVQNAGIKETDEIVVIECERLDGDKMFHAAKSGNMIKLREHIDAAKADVHGCAT